jgi:hypothetical protein
VQLPPQLHGNSNPSNGIVIEHPSNVTPRAFAFYLMVFDVSAADQIPEFSSLPVAVVILALTVFIARGRAFT